MSKRDKQSKKVAFWGLCRSKSKTLDSSDSSDETEEVESYLTIETLESEHILLHLDYEKGRQPFNFAPKT